MARRVRATPSRRTRAPVAGPGRPARSDAPELHRRPWSGRRPGAATLGSRPRPVRWPGPADRRAGAGRTARGAPPNRPRTGERDGPQVVAERHLDVCPRRAAAAVGPAAGPTGGVQRGRGGPGRRGPVRTGRRPYRRGAEQSPRSRRSWRWPRPRRSRPGQHGQAGLGGEAVGAGHHAVRGANGRERHERGGHDRTVGRARPRSRRGEGGGYERHAGPPTDPGLTRTIGRDARAPP